MTDEIDLAFRPKPPHKSGGKMTRRRAASVVLLDAEDSSWLDDFVNRLDLRRNASATFAVWGNKFGENPETGRRGWLGWEKIEGLKSPLAIKRAIEDTAYFLSARFEWGDLIPLIGTIDWVTASVIASTEGLEIPALPEVDDLLSQRSLRALGKVKIGAEWGDEIHEFELSFERWVRVLGGESWETDKPYWHEGRRFTATWSFDGEGQLEVTYDDAGVGWEGPMAGLAVIEGPKLDDVDLARLALSSANSA